MKDRDFLMWLHARLEYVYGESALVDHMQKLRAIIRTTPEKRETQNCNACNGLEELQRELSNEPSSPTSCEGCLTVRSAMAGHRASNRNKTRTRHSKQ